MDTAPFARIIDGHVHAASTRFLPRRFLEGIADNTCVKLESEGRPASRSAVLQFYEASLQDHECDRLVEQMDAAGIAEAVLLLPDFTYALGEDGYSIADMYRLHHQILQRHPGRFYVFAAPDPRWGRDGIDLFMRGVREYGFCGAKLYPPCGYDLGERSLYPVYEICADRGLPVLTHIGGTSPALDLSRASPLQVDRAARDFPRVNFILAHAGCSYTPECLMLARYRPNVYLDISAYTAASLPAVEYLLAQEIGHKIIFGTDWPVTSIAGSLAAQVTMLRDCETVRARLSEGVAANFFAGNMARLIGT